MKQTSASDPSLLAYLLRALSIDGVRALSPTEIERCVLYYELVCKWNPLLHLTTLVAPEDFAFRHLGESFVAESRLRSDVSVLWDVGSGVGVPGIPIAVRRPDLNVKLVERNRRKSVFLDEAVAMLHLARVSVFSGRFDSLPFPPPGACVTARAVERMDSVVAEIFSRSSGAIQLLLFGGRNLEPLISATAADIWRVEVALLPNSDDRRLYDLQRST